jgi:hypothetical protein
MPQGSKLAVNLVHPYIHMHHPSFSPYLLPCAWKKERGAKKKERARNKERGREY